MNFSTVPNPYDFANPVNDRKLFAGRGPEMDEIEYYLNHAKNAARAINLAVIGGRASGKTSLLNMIQLSAEEKGLCSVRVDLDESDSANQLVFFQKLFDSLLTVVCEQGVFGGIHGKTYDIYRDMIDAYQIPDDKTFCPFIFPIQYAKAMSQGNIDIPLSDTAFKRDLTTIHTTLGRSIVILMDECNVLGKNRVLIEKLRNIFMNIEGFILVLAGTETLFPILNEVFSPIVRQFKKVNVKPFNKVRETRDCILKPLQNFGINPSQLLDPETFHDVSAIHNLSGGRPYEIQLICHLLFRRIQEGRSKTMEITVDVLDDVLYELQTSQDTSVRPIINAIRSLDETQLLALAALCACNGRADLDRIWFIEYLFGGQQQWTKEQLAQHLHTFDNLGIITVRDNLIDFAGDDFDRVYCKYYSRKRGISFDIKEIPFEICLLLRLNDFIEEEFVYMDAGPFIETSNVPDDDPLTIVAAFESDDKEKNPFLTENTFVKFLYESNLEFYGCDEYRILEINLVTPWARTGRWYAVQSDNCSVDDHTEEINSALRQLDDRARVLDGRIETKSYTIPVLPIHTFCKRILATENEVLKREKFELHLDKMYEAYNESHGLEEALANAKFALLYDAEPSDQAANNIGYVSMVGDDLITAERLFTNVINKTLVRSLIPLSQYNLAVAWAKQGNLAESMDLLEKADAEASHLSVEDQICACLVAIYTEGNKLRFDEVENPNLPETIKSSMDHLRQFLADPNPGE